MVLYDYYDLDVWLGKENEIENHGAFNPFLITYSHTELVCIEGRLSQFLLFRGSLNNILGPASDLHYTECNGTQRMIWRISPLLLPDLNLGSGDVISLPDESKILEASN